MELAEVLPRLKEKFPPECHKERDLPGSGRWWYVSWQQIRERLDEVCPDWQVNYSEPHYLDKYCHVSCSLTICGVTRTAIGNAPIELISRQGNDMARGTPIERAIADAFKNAAESFGVARYLDDQADEKTKADFIRYMHKAGNSKPAVQYRENQRIEQGLPEKSQRKDPPSKPFGQPQKTTAIAPSQPATLKERVVAIVKATGHNSDQVRIICESYQLPTNSGQFKAPEQVIKLRDELFVDWGNSQGKFKNVWHCRQSYKKLLEEFMSEPDDAIVWKAWKAKVTEKEVAQAS